MTYINELSHAGQANGCTPPPSDIAGFNNHLPMGEGDILHGAAAIAKVLFGNAKERRRVYYRVERGEIPFFLIGGTICSTRSALNRMIARNMREAARELEVN